MSETRIVGVLLSTMVKRFQKYLVEAESGCLLWTGGVDRWGYGLFKVGEERMLAHRVAWELERGSTGGLFVCHHCDTPRCCRVEHLFLGTHEDNMADMSAKGRTLRFRPEQVTEAALLHASGMTLAALGRRFGFDPKTIRTAIQKRARSSSQNTGPQTPAEAKVPSVASTKESP